MTILKDLSDRAKQALERARALAANMGDSCVGTGHFIYGLTADHLSVGNRVFNDIFVYPEMFRDHLKQLPRETERGGRSGLHPLVDEAIERGRKTRQKLGDGGETTTDHLLIGLLSLREGSAAACMREFSVEPDEISGEILEALGFQTADRPEW